MAFSRTTPAELAVFGKGANKRAEKDLERAKMTSRSHAGIYATAQMSQGLDRTMQRRETPSLHLTPHHRNATLTVVPG
jgi:hypothetical protein